MVLYKQSNSPTTICLFSVGNTNNGLPFVEFITREYGFSNLSSIWLWEEDEDNPLDNDDEEPLLLDDWDTEDRDDWELEDLDDWELEDLDEEDTEDIEMLESEDAEWLELLEDIDKEEDDPEDIKFSFLVVIMFPSNQ